MGPWRVLAESGRPDIFRTRPGRPDSRTRFHFHDLFKCTKQIYENNIVNIDQYIENDKLIIYNNAIVFEKFSFNGNIIEDKDNKFKPENLSKYFDDYFLYHERNDIFVYCNHLWYVSLLDILNKFKK